MPLEPAPIDRLLSPFQRFIKAESSGGIALMIATALALFLANSPWSEWFNSIWQTNITVGVGSGAIAKPALLWINDGLMAVFFLLVGLEIKREILVGELSSPRRALLPAAAAIGGMVGPAIIFLIFNWGSDAAKAWGVPMATDIAFAIGVMAMLGKRVPVGLKVFLVALAIVDDLGAVAVVAIVYTESISVPALAYAGGVMVALIIVNMLGVRKILPYALFGLVLWVLILKSGVHATVAGVLLAATIPAKIRLSGESFQEKLKLTANRLREDDFDANIYSSQTRQSAIHELEQACEHAQAPLLKLEHALLPWISYFIMPIFALANAGVALDATIIEKIRNPIALGIAVGLFLGNQIGVTLITWFMIKCRWCVLPEGVNMKQIYGAACLAGIGFTMSIFIAGLAFDTPENLEIAKVGILLGSLASGIMGVIVLLSVCKKESSSSGTVVAQA